MYDSLALYRRDSANMISNAQVSCFRSFMTIIPASIRQAIQYLQMREMNESVVILKTPTPHSFEKKPWKY